MRDLGCYALDFIPRCGDWVVVNGHRGCVDETEYEPKTPNPIITVILGCHHCDRSQPMARRQALVASVSAMESKFPG